MDLLQLLILLSITGICGAFAELLIGFSPRGLHVMLVSMIVGVVGAFLGIWFRGLLDLPYLLPIRVGTTRLDLIYTVLGSVGLLLLLQVLRSGGRRVVGRRAP